MSYLARFATFAGIGSVLGLSACPSVPASLSEPHPLLNRNQAREHSADQGEKEPTFEETKAFLLKYTSKTWQESPGNRHAYTLAFVNKRLKYGHKFTSNTVPGYSEKIEVELSDLDPTQVGKKDSDLRTIALETTNGEQKVFVEVTMLLPSEGFVTRKYKDRKLSVPGSDQETTEAQNKEEQNTDARLKKAWVHLITLAGGKPSKDEPF